MDNSGMDGGITRRAALAAPAVIGGAMAGDKLVRPVNAPPAGAASPGVQPGTSSGITLAHYVVVTGTGGGIFVYSGQPRKGNPPIAWTTAASADPYGNPVSPQMGTRNNANGSGVTLSGSAVILTGPGSTSQGFLSTQRNGTGNSSQTQTNLSSATDEDQVTQVIMLGESVDTSQAARGILQGFSLSEGIAVPIVWQVNGPLTATHPGSPTGAAPSGSPETWQDMILLNGWTVGASGMARYKLMADDTVMIEATQLIPGTATGGTSIWTPPTGYQAPNTQRLELVIENSTGTASVDTPRMDIGQNSLVVWNIPSGTTRVGFTARYTLD